MEFLQQDFKNFPNVNLKTCAAKTLLTMFILIRKCKLVLVWLQEYLDIK